MEWKLWRLTIPGLLRTISNVSVITSGREEALIEILKLTKWRLQTRRNGVHIARSKRHHSKGNTTKLLADLPLFIHIERDSEPQCLFRNYVNTLQLVSFNLITTFVALLLEILFALFRR